VKDDESTKADKDKSSSSESDDVKDGSGSESDGEEVDSKNGDLTERYSFLPSHLPTLSSYSFLLPHHLRYLTHT
jgi:hypothetical protein